MRGTVRTLAVAALAISGLVLAPAGPAAAGPAATAGTAAADPAATAGPAGLAGPAEAGPARPFPSTIDLPVGFRPEGITTGPGPFAYLGSLADGSIYRVNLVTGTGRVISPGGGPTAPSVGLKSDQRGRLFVAGGPGGNGRVIDARTGAVLRTYTFTTVAPTFVNDVVLTPDAAYFTDSRKGVLYKVRLGRNGRPAGTFETLTLTGPIVIDPAANNANGIARTPDGRGLLIIQSNTGLLWRVDPRTGAVTRVDVPGDPLVNGDGLLLLGRMLYVVQNRLNTVAVIGLNRRGTAGERIGAITDPGFDIPTTVAAFGNRLYLPNARFGIPAPETAAFTVVAVRR
jgi:sugar lactone lactonase YvrE